MKYEGGFVQSLSSQPKEPLLGVAEINLTWHALIIFIMRMLRELDSVCWKTNTIISPIRYFNHKYDWHLVLMNLPLWRKCLEMGRINRNDWNAGMLYWNLATTIFVGRPETDILFTTNISRMVLSKTSSNFRFKLNLLKEYFTDTARSLCWNVVKYNMYSTKQTNLWIFINSQCLVEKLGQR